MQPIKWLVDFIDVRLGVKDIYDKELHGYLLPRNVNVWYTLGAVLMVLFKIADYHRYPAAHVLCAGRGKRLSPASRHIMNDVPYGWLFPMLHAVGANVIMIALLLHMLSVLFMGSYKGRREFTWLTGFTILNLTMGLCLTGYLLPWSQLSFWATTVATDAAGAIPVVGDYLVEFLRGGPTVGNQTLGRFFALHVVGMPLVLLGLIGRPSVLRQASRHFVPPFGDDYKASEELPFFEHEKHHGWNPLFPELFCQRCCRHLLLYRFHACDHLLCSGPVLPRVGLPARRPVCDTAAHQAGVVFPLGLPDSEDFPQ